MNVKSLFQNAYRWMIPVLLVLTGFFCLWWLSQQAEHWVFDAFSRWSAKPSANSPVTLVIIDDESLSRLQEDFGQPPWPRMAYVTIFKRLQTDYKPAVTVFDGHFMNIQRQEDRQVFNALKTIPNLIVGLVTQNTTTQEYHEVPHRKFPAKVSDLSYYQLNLGVVNVLQNPDDGIIRKIIPLYTPKTNTPGILKSLALATTLEYLKVYSPHQAWGLNVLTPPGQPPILSLYSEALPSLDKQIPVNVDGSILLRWQRLKTTAQIQQMGFDGEHPAFSHQAFPLWRLLQAPAAEKAQFQQTLKNGILMIGSSSSLYQDFHHTPLSVYHLGADIQATAIDNLLNSETIRLVPPWLNILVCLLCFVGVVLLRLKLNSLEKAVLYTLGSMIIYLWFAYWLFDAHAYAIHVVTPEVFMILGMLLSNLLLAILKDKEVSLLEGHLSKLVSQSVFKEIRSMSKIITQGGRKLDITALFVDIRNFTTLAENLPPQQVTDLLNEFYTLVVDTVFSHKGTVDKFMGDGVLILFGAPLPDAMHANLALDAAKDVLKKSETLTQRWKDTLGVDTRIGISINSGGAFVGFIGPKNKLEYTAIGDTINLCVRLQEQTKVFNEPMIISQYTLDALQPQTLQPKATEYPAEFKELAEITVKGREAPLVIYGYTPDRITT